MFVTFYNIQIIMSISASQIGLIIKDKILFNKF